MSGGILVVQEPVAQLVVGRSAAPAVLSVGRQVATLVAVAQQGPAGRNGVDGVDGQNGMGQITYTDRTIGDEDLFDPGVRKRLLFAPTGLTTQNLLRHPFETHQFFVDNVLRARAMGDVYDITINLAVRSMQAGGKIRVDIDSGSPLGPLQTSTALLFEGAMVLERVTLNFSIQVLATFLANGALFYLTADRPLQVVSETLFLRPASVQP